MVHTTQIKPSPLLQPSFIVTHYDSLITEQLEDCTDITKMGALLNAFFIRKLFSQKPNHYTQLIAIISNTIFKNKGLVSVDRLAADADMSLRA